VKVETAAPKAARRGQIDLKAENETSYRRDGHNVQLSPIPTFWSHEDLRRLLRRVHAPCPSAWNLQPAKGLAWIDYGTAKDQRDAIAALHNLLLPGGHALTATPVDTEKKKRPAFYRVCDDGRVMPEEPAPSRPEAAEASRPPAHPGVRGRGFVAFPGALARKRLRADEEDDDDVQVMTETAAPSASSTLLNHPRDGYASDGSARPPSVPRGGGGAAAGGPNAALLAKYTVILKRLNERKRAMGADPSASDEEPGA